MSSSSSEIDADTDHSVLAHQEYPMEARALLIAGKLHGKSDFSTWSTGLKIALHEIDRRLWEILTGTYTPCTLRWDEHGPINRDKLFLHLVRGYRAQNPAIPTGWNWTETDDYITANFTDIDKWNPCHPNSWSVVAILFATCKPHIREILVGCDNAPSAWKLLLSTYGSLSEHNLAQKVDAWINCVYIPDEKQEDFIHRWRSALRDVTTCLSPANKISEPILCAVFFAAACTNPSSDGWISSTSLKLTWESTLESTLFGFILYQEGLYQEDSKDF